jgi:hypothetical protein
MKQQIANGEREALEILVEDLELYFNKEDEEQMVEEFKTNVKRYVKIFTEISCELMPKRTKVVGDDDVCC